MMSSGMMDFGPGWLGLLALMLVLWGGLLAAAIWLVGLLFPAAHPNDPKNSTEKRA